MPGPVLRFRYAAASDIDVLGELNQRLIRDEGHRNPMTQPELTQRMAGWLAGEYEAVVFEMGNEIVGYALYHFEDAHVYLRQFFVAPEYRRERIGLKAVRWLLDNPFRRRPRVRLDVLIGNVTAIQFWRAVGFKNYCITMEMDSDPPNVHS